MFEEVLNFGKNYLKKEAPLFNIGDVVKVGVSIKEGEKERVQFFEGTVIAKKHGGISETFTVRKISGGIGVERVFPVHSPHVKTVEVLRKGKVRRAKLYYLRKRVGKAAKVKERIWEFFKSLLFFLLSSFLLFSKLQFLMYYMLNRLAKKRYKVV